MPGYETKNERGRKSMNTEQWRHVKMPFGKHEGLTLWQIAKTYPEYLQWMERKEAWPRDPAVAIAVRAAIRHLKETHQWPDVLRQPVLRDRFGAW